MSKSRNPQPERRKFFYQSARKVAETVVKHTDAAVLQRAKRWIRPPFARDELEFLLTCTRCERCAEACPYQVIFPLAPRLGGQVAGTPALDLLNHGCHLCSDWPCVEACLDDALVTLVQSDSDPPPTPYLAVATVNEQVCLPFLGPECGACADSCSITGALCWEGSKLRIDPDHCVGCGQCREACIAEPKAINISSL